MREIRLSGSEGGAAHARPYPYRKVSRKRLDMRLLPGELFYCPVRAESQDRRELCEETVMQLGEFGGLGPTKH